MKVMALALLLQVTGADEGSAPTGMSWQGPAPRTGYRYTARGDAVESPGASITLASIGSPREKASAVGTAVSAHDLAGQRIRISARIRANGLDGNASLWLRIEGASARQLVLENGRDHAVSGTTAWRDAEIVLWVPARAEVISYGVRINGLGEVAVEGLRFESLTGRTDVSRRGFVASLASVDSTIAAAGNPAELRAILQKTIGLFLESWFAAWSSGPSTSYRRSWRLTANIPRPGQTVNVPGANLLHCHPTNEPGYDIRVDRLVIEGGRGRHARCATWLLSAPRAEHGDDRLNIDTAIAPALRAEVSTQRGQLIARLERARTLQPHDSWTTGQLIRFLVDQRDTSSAIAATSRCAAERWWCTVLAGYVVHWSGRSAEADSIFAVAIPLMPDSVRCEWTDLGALLPPAARSDYGRRGCAARDSINRVVWWLAKPAFTEHGHDRRAEHFARHVLIALRSAVERDALHDWSEEFGGGAVRQMVLRYGWPTSTWWGGPGADRGHQAYLGTRGAARPAHFTTNEYSLVRFHVMPSLAAVTAPLKSRAADWELSADAAFRNGADLKPPQIGYREVRRWDGPSLYVADTAPLQVWWPKEHFDRGARGPLVQLLTEQTAFFRRDTATLLAMAADLPRMPLGAIPGEAMRGSLALSSAPDSFRFHEAGGTVGGTAAVQTLVTSGPQLASLELKLDRTVPVTARIRYGIVPLPPLNVHSEGTVGLSDIALLSADAVTIGPPDPDRVLPLMLGTTELKDVRRVGMYWESYGIANDDTIEVSYRVESLDPPGALTRLGQALGLVDRTERAITIRPARVPAEVGATPIGAMVPTYGRTIVLDLSQLIPGRYRLAITVNARGTSATTQREIEIVQ